MDLIDKIKAGSQATKDINWPGSENMIRIRLCNESDFLLASQQTDKIFEGTRIAAENVDQYSAEKETQLLFRAILDPTTDKQLFTNITEFRSVLTPEIKNILGEALDALHEEYSPDPETISEEDFDKLVQDVKKNAEAIENVSNIFTLRKLVRYLTSQLQN